MRYATYPQMFQKKNLCMCARMYILHIHVNICVCIYISYVTLSKVVIALFLFLQLSSMFESIYKLKWGFFLSGSKVVVLKILVAVFTVAQHKWQKPQEDSDYWLDKFLLQAWDIRWEELSTFSLSSPSPFFLEVTFWIVRNWKWIHPTF